MNRIPCLVVEDEPLAAKILSEYIQQTPFLELKGVCEDALAAADFLKAQPVGLMLLDLHLPEVKGFDFLRGLPAPPLVIVTTACHQYALEGYELNVVDYLLKPVEYERFLTAADKARSLYKPAVTGAAEGAFIYLPVNKKKIKIHFGDILYAESRREYVQVFTGREVITSKMPITRLEGLLPPGRFIRIHRSYIVAKDKVTAISATSVEVSGLTLPVGRMYRGVVGMI